MKWTMQVMFTDFQCEMIGLPLGSIGYISAYDVNARGGIGEAEVTLDIEEAILWDTAREVLQAWRTQSTVRPIRGDGQPNRPLSAYTITVLPVPGPSHTQ